MATGGRDTGGFESQKELLVRDAGPAPGLRSAFRLSGQGTRIRHEESDVKRDRYVGGAVSSINRYAEAVGYRSGGIGQGSTRGDSPSIVPRDDDSGASALTLIRPFLPPCPEGTHLRGRRTVPFPASRERVAP